MTFIPVAAPVIDEREIEYVTDAVRSGWVSSLGPYIPKFEQAFADYVGVEHGIAVSSGTAGLHLAIHTLGIGPGDEVLVPDLTFVATANTVIQTGATPVFVDVDPDTWCIDPEAIKKAITPKTKAIIPVHLYGHPADMNQIMEIAKLYHLFVIEDAAESHGASLEGKKVGSFGDIGIFSFYGNKIITTGEGGIVMTNDSTLADRLRYLKDHGMSPQKRYYHTELGFNYRMTNIQAAIGLAQMEQIENFIAKKRTIFETYSKYLSEIPHIRLNFERKNVRNVYWLTSLVLEKNAKIDRDQLGEKLKLNDIDWRPFFVSMHNLPYLQKYKKIGRYGNDCSVSTFLSEQGMNLPSGCALDLETISMIALYIKNQLTKDAI